MTQAQHTDLFMLSSEEKDLYSQRLIMSPVLRYLKMDLSCSSTRLAYRKPSVLLGFIPLNSPEIQAPLINIASISMSHHIKFKKFLLGLIFLFLGTLSAQAVKSTLTVMSHPSVIGIMKEPSILDTTFTYIILFAYVAIPFFLSLWCFLTSFPPTLTIVTSGGEIKNLSVSIFEKVKLALFYRELQDRLFADKDQIRHNEAQSQRLMQTHLQEDQLQELRQINKKLK